MNDNNNDSILSLKNDINILLERLGKLEASEENKNEIELIRLELQRLNNRAIQLEQNINNNSNIDEHMNNLPNNGQMIYKNNLPPQNYRYQARNNYTQVNNLPPNINKNLQFNIDKQNKHTDLEKNIGTNVMSVLAAILIFVGIASLTALVYKNFSNTMKFILMISITFTVSLIGVLFLNKKRNIFNYSITAIGVGGVYISLIASGIMDVLNLPVLTLLIIGWTCLVHWQNLKYNSFVLYLIELLGFEIAIIMGLASLKYSLTNYIISLTLILGNVIYLVLLENLHKLKPSLNTILDTIVEVSRFRLLYLLIYNVEEFNKTGIGLAYFILVILSIIVSMLFSLDRVIKTYAKNNRDSLIVHIIFSYIILAFGVFSILVKSYIISESFLANISKSDIMFLVTVLYCYFINIAGLRKVDNQFSKNLTYVILAIGYIISIGNSFIYMISSSISNIQDFGYVTPALYNIFIIILVLKLGIILVKYTNDIFYRKLALIFSSVHSVITFISVTYVLEGYFCSIMHTILMCIIICLELFAFMKLITKYLENLAEHKSIFDKVLLMVVIDTIIIGSIFIIPKVLMTGFFDGSSKEADVLLIIVATTLTLYKVHCSRLGYFTNFNFLDEAMSFNLLNKCDWSYRLFLLSNMFWVAMFSNTSNSINSMLSMLVFITVTLSILTLTFIGSIRSLRQNTKHYGIILGIKYAIVLRLLIYLWSESFKWLDGISSIAYSVLLLVMCISFIICGWSVKIKSLRMFGLLGTIFSIVKLLFIDIHFNDSLIKTLAYIISGIMCAIIVWLYDRMNKEDRSENQ